MALKLNSVLITDEVDSKCIDILKRNGVAVVFNPKLAKDKEALLAELPKHDGLIVRSATKVTADIIAASNLSIIGRAGTGTDNIDSVAATNKGVIVMNTPGGNTISAAELTCSMICGIARNVGTACMSMKEGRWDRKLFMGEELQGKTLAIVGLGRIGREVGSRMRSFGMETIGYDPLVSAEESAAFDVTSYELEDLWPRADYITVHVPLIPPTKNLINSTVLSKCRRGVKIINCARGGIVDEDALLDALNSGQCGGAGLDVYVQEPPSNLDLVKHKNTLATPHLGASTVEAQTRVAEEIAQQFVDARDGKSLFGAINAQALVNAMSPESQPLVELGVHLGAMTRHLAGPSKTITVMAHGDATMKRSLSFLQSAVCMGLLNEKSANLVNSLPLIKEAGYKVEAQYASGEDNCVSVLCNDMSLVKGCVKGGLTFLGFVAGVQLHSPMQLSAGKTYFLFTTSNREAGNEILSAMIGQLGLQGIAMQSFTSGLTDSSCVGLAQIASIPADSSLSHNALLSHYYISL
ncbi:D-3-phosphoglycerate dehydrogenase-like [Watersipora subatra]|uniref:D-3-phosphoglycerate dehydrogenase-like n=1 Tax=Watersipora subatra TaxID=2589382 RepID=UPI00355C410E